MTAVFDLCGPLPRGTTMLQASAGTGKTYTIEALVTRFVAEGAAQLTDLLVIAYGRAATAELRERVRARLLAARDALADPVAAGDDDPVVRHLAAAAPHEVAERRARLAAAVASFDEATITTTHQFCSRMLASLGVGADVDPDETFVEDLGELVDEVVADVYVRTFAGADAPEPGLTVSQAKAVATAVVADPQAFLDVPASEAGSPAAQRLAFAVAVRAEVARRRRQRGLVTYDDLVGRLSDALSREEDCERNRAWLRATYRVVMVDEFQDTDRLQWQILRDAFHGHGDLILIGDPKQAIYGFRGGDVVTYLTASDAADHHLTLPDNHRSDARLVAAVSRFFGDLPLGDDRIRLTAVTGRHEARLRGPGATDPLRMRLVPWRGRKAHGVDAARAWVAADLAADIHRLLHDGTELCDDSGRWRPVQPGDIAVLVPRWKDAEDVAAALRPYGVRVVTTGASSVFASPAARHWLALLRALDQPHQRTLLRAAMITPMLGYTGEQLAADGDRLADEAATRVRGWAKDLADGGVAALLHAVTVESGVLTTALQRPDGERELTDLRHVAEALHDRSRTGPGANALATWLAARITEAGRDRREEVQRRVDSDADAVQVLTVFGSKGLEFPIVYVPHAWNRYIDARRLSILRYHSGGRRIVDPLGHDTPDWEHRKDQHVAEESGETLRLLYVSLTRASRQVVLWWAPTAQSTHCSALHRVLGARLSGDTEIRPQYDCGLVTVPALSALGIPAVEVPSPAPPAVPLPPAGGPGVAELRVAAFDRTLDTAWRRTSYSGLTAAAHEYAFAAESVTGERDDEPAGPEDDATTEFAAAPLEDRSPMGLLPKGATFGTAVHHALEVLPTAQGDPRQELLRATTEALTARPVTGVDATTLAAGLLPAITTPLGPLAGDVTLWQLPPAHRLAELDFEYPLAPGGEDVLLGDIAALLRMHLPGDDPLAEYPDRMHRDGLAPTRLRGFLSGSIDAVLRVGEPGARRFLVTDYKTNWLGRAAPGALTVQDHDPAAMAAAMLAAHYPLQALLYCVALHRYLRWRQPGYDPDSHLGGVLYLFLRGMAGPDTPRPQPGAAPFGVFSWQPGAALVTDLSELLAGRRP